MVVVVLVVAAAMVEVVVAAVVVLLLVLLMFLSLYYRASSLSGKVPSYLASWSWQMRFRSKHVDAGGAGSSNC